MSETLDNAVWVSSEGELIFGDPRSQGFIDCGCDFDMLQNPTTKDYVEPIKAVRIHKDAVDGACKPVKFKTLTAASKYCKDEGLAGDGGVSDDGVVRFGGAEWQHGVSKTWFSIPAPIESKIRRGMFV